MKDVLGVFELLGTKHNKAMVAVERCDETFQLGRAWYHTIPQLLEITL